MTHLADYLVALSVLHSVKIHRFCDLRVPCLSWGSLMHQAQGTKMMLCSSQTTFIKTLLKMVLHHSSRALNLCKRSVLASCLICYPPVSNKEIFIIPKRKPADSSRLIALKWKDQHRTENSLHAEQERTSTSQFLLFKCISFSRQSV